MDQLRLNIEKIGYHAAVLNIIKQRDENNEKKGETHTAIERDRR